METKKNCLEITHDIVNLIWIKQCKTNARVQCHYSNGICMYERTSTWTDIITWRKNMGPNYTRTERVQRWTNCMLIFYFQHSENMQVEYENGNRLNVSCVLKLCSLKADGRKVQIECLTLVKFILVERIKHSNTKYH